MIKTIQIISGTIYSKKPLVVNNLNVVNFEFRSKSMSRTSSRFSTTVHSTFYEIRLYYCIIKHFVGLCLQGQMSIVMADIVIISHFHDNSFLMTLCRH